MVLEAFLFYPCISVFTSNTFRAQEESHSSLTSEDCFFFELVSA